MVKKIILIVTIIVGAFMMLSGVAPIIIGAILKARVAGSVGIIGGADGPTAVLVVGSLGAGSCIVELVIGIILVITGSWGYRIYKKK